MAFPLKPLVGEGDSKPKGKFYVCDIETAKWVNFLIIGLSDGEDYWEFEDMGEFFDFLFKLPGATKEIYAHNGGRFDFLFLLEHLFFKTPHQVTKMIPRGSGLLCFDVSNVTEKDALKIKTLSFKDSVALLPFALRTLCESFKAQHLKGEIDYKAITKVTPELRKYLKHDCLGLHEVLTKFFDWPLVKRAGPASTVASQSLRIYRTFMEKPIPDLWEGHDAFVRKSYFGGRTEVFKGLYDGGKSKGRIDCYDVNSLYPTVMYRNHFPTACEGFTRTFKPEKMGFYEATVEVPESMYVPPLGTVMEVNGTPKFIFPTGQFSGVWSTIELKYAMSLGVKVLKTEKGLIFRDGGPIFEGYIDMLYEMRLRAEKDSVDNVLAKLFMNSLYGRFGLNKEREGIEFDYGQRGVKPFLEIGKDRDALRLVKTPVHLDTFTNVAISAWVTSLARIHMHKNVYTPCGRDLWYTDTDSVFTTHKFKNSDKLGDLKLEYSGKRACFLLPKTYLIESDEEVFKWKDEDNRIHKTNRKIVMKGFDKRKIQHFTADDFMEALEGELKHMRAVQPEKFATFKTAVSKKKLVMMMEESERSIQSRYDKRRVIENSPCFDTRPLHVTGGYAI